MQGARATPVVCLISWQKPESHQNLRKRLCSSFLPETELLCLKAPEQKGTCTFPSSNKLLSFG